MEVDLLEARPPVVCMSEEGTVTPELEMTELQQRLDEESDRLKKLYAAYEAQEKELLDMKAEIEILEKEIIEREIEKEAQDNLLARKQNRINELEMSEARVSQRVEHLEPELQKMEEKYSREKDRLGKVFGIAEELDNDLRLAVTELRVRDEWYVDHMGLFEDLNKAIKQRYEMIEKAIEAEKESQHMGRAITEKMEEIIESRAAEMTIEEAEAQIDAESPQTDTDSNLEGDEAPAEETEEVPEAEASEETESEVSDEEWNWSESVLAGVMEKHNISDKEGFIEFAKAYDKDNNRYLKGSELGAAALDWVKKEAGEEPAESQESTPSNVAQTEWATNDDPWADA